MEVYFGFEQEQGEDYTSLLAKQLDNDNIDAESGNENEGRGQLPAIIK